jgi:hypothetical protein
MSYFEERLYFEMNLLEKKMQRLKQFADFVKNHEELTDEELNCLESWYNHSSYSPQEILENYF